jgi:hypothetical protein
MLRSWLPEGHCLKCDGAAFKVLDAIICRPWPPLAVELANYEFVLKGGVSKCDLLTELKLRLPDLKTERTFSTLPSISLKCKSKLPALGILKRSINRMRKSDPLIEFKDLENDYYNLRVNFNLKWRCRYFYMIRSTSGLKWKSVFAKPRSEWW